MTKTIEFRLWLSQCCLDAQDKLELKNTEIAYTLLQEAEKWLLESLIDRETNKALN